MEPRELNRDIKRLSKNHGNMEVKKEIRRLYNADQEMVYMNAYSIRMLLRLNLRYRTIAPQWYGLSINLPKE